MKSQVLHTVRCYISVRLQEKFEIDHSGSERVKRTSKSLAKRIHLFSIFEVMEKS